MRYSVLAAIVWAVVAPHIAAAGIVIDSFDTAQAVVDIDPINDSTVAAPEAIGGFRTLVASDVTQDGTTSLVVSGGRLLLAGTSTRRNAAVYWNGGLAPDGLGGVDLTEGGLDDRFLVTAGTLDVDGATFTLIVTSDADRRSRFTVDAPGGGGLALFALPFADFLTNADGPADFTDVREILLTIGTTNGALGVDGIVVAGSVPEPAMLVLLLSLLGALWLQRWAAVD